jgi:phosphatidylcholine synthase
MIKRIAAASVHVLTASGAVLALLALQAAHVGDIQMMFVWLGIALVVDAVDGPLARAIDVKMVLPRFSKTKEGYFVGFPAIWNIVLLYLFALSPPPYVVLAIVAGFIALTFIPILCVHPFRVARLRPLTCLVTLIWIGAAAIAVAQPFPSPLWVQTLLLVTAAYFSAIGFARSLAQS